MTLDTGHFPGNLLSRRYANIQDCEERRWRSEALTWPKCEVRREMRKVPRAHPEGKVCYSLECRGLLDHIHLSYFGQMIQRIAFTCAAVHYHGDHYAQYLYCDHASQRKHHLIRYSALTNLNLLNHASLHYSCSCCRRVYYRIRRMYR